MTMLKKEPTTYRPVLRQSIITLPFYSSYKWRREGSLIEVSVKESVSSPGCFDWWTWKVFVHFVCKCETQKAPLSFQKESTSWATNL